MARRWGNLPVVLGLVLAFPAGAAGAPGDLDETFSGDGLLSGTSPPNVVDAAIAPDGSVVVIGGGPQGGAAIARYSPNGAPDPTLDGDGVRTLDGPLYPRAVAIQPDGKVVLVGSVSDAGSQVTEFEVIR